MNRYLLILICVMACFADVYGARRRRRGVLPKAHIVQGIQSTVQGTVSERSVRSVPGIGLGAVAERVARIRTHQKNTVSQTGTLVEAPMIPRTQTGTLTKGPMIPRTGTSHKSLATDTKRAKGVKLGAYSGITSK
jgi:hypothetical protein